MTAVPGPTSGLMCSPALSTIPQLDAEQHDIDLADVLGIVGRLRRRKMGIAAGALDLEPVGFHRGQMRTARDEGDIRPGFRQRRAKSASDAAGADHSNPHSILLHELDVPPD